MMCMYSTDQKISNCETDGLGLMTVVLGGTSQYSILFISID